MSSRPISTPTSARSVRAPVHSLADSSPSTTEHNAARDAVLRTGDRRRWPQKKGPLTEPRTGRRWRPAVRFARTLGLDAVMTTAPARRAGRADRRAGVADRLVNGDHCTGGSSQLARGGRLSAHHRARRIRVRPAGRHLVLRPRLERADAVQARLRVRAGDEASEDTDLRGDGGSRFRLAGRPSRAVAETSSGRYDPR